MSKLLITRVLFHNHYALAAMLLSSKSGWHFIWCVLNVILPSLDLLQCTCTCASRTLSRWSLPPELRVQIRKCLVKRKHCLSPSFLSEREPSRTLLSFPRSTEGNWIKEPAEEIEIADRSVKSDTTAAQMINGDQRHLFHWTKVHKKKGNAGDVQSGIQSEFMKVQCTGYWMCKSIRNVDVYIIWTNSSLAFTCSFDYSNYLLRSVVIFFVISCNPHCKLSFITHISCHCIIFDYIRFVSPELDIIKFIHEVEWITHYICVCLRSCLFAQRSGNTVKVCLV